MSGNPNMQKIGKRKTPGGQKQPDWLFPTKEMTASTPKTQHEDQHKNKKDKQLAKNLLKRRAAGGPPKSVPPPQLLKLVSSFLSEYEFTTTAQVLETESKSRGNSAEASENAPSLDTIYTEWRDFKGQNNGLGADAAAVKVKSVKKQKSLKQKSDTSTSDSDSSSDDSIDDSDVEMADSLRPTLLTMKRQASDSSSVSSSSSDSDADDEDDVPVKTQSSKSKVNGLKRKAASSSDSSSGSDSSSEEERPKTKKLKTEAISVSSDSNSSSEEDSSSDSSSDPSSDDEPPKNMKYLTMKESSSDSETSSSDSDSDSDSSTNSIAQKIPLPDSDSDSSSDSSSDSDSESSQEDAKKKPVVGSDTSATLSDGPKKFTASDDSSSDSSSSSDSELAAKPVKMEYPAAESKPAKAVIKRELSPPLPPDPVAKASNGRVNKRFSRIPENIEVDQRLASNAYVPYDYAQKAHEDLIVTKGKGFTKEKNKKKRGSYRGGYIDVEGKKGIKFED